MTLYGQVGITTVVRLNEFPLRIPRDVFYWRPRGHHEVINWINFKLNL